MQITLVFLKSRTLGLRHGSDRPPCALTSPVSPRASSSSLSASNRASDSSRFTFGRARHPQCTSSASEERRKLTYTSRGPLVSMISAVAFSPRQPRGDVDGPRKGRCAPRKCPQTFHSVPGHTENASHT